MKHIIAVLLITVASIANADLVSKPKFVWTPPAAFEDGSPLNPATDLSMYHIYCNAGAIDIQITDPTATSYQAKAGEFPQGDNECQMTAVSTTGQESVYSAKKLFTLVNRPAVINFSVQ